MAGGKRSRDEDEVSAFLFDLPRVLTSTRGPTDARDPRTALASHDEVQAARRAVSSTDEAVPVSVAAVNMLRLFAVAPQTAEASFSVPTSESAVENERSEEAAERNRLHARKSRLRAKLRTDVILKLRVEMEQLYNFAKEVYKASFEKDYDPATDSRVKVDFVDVCTKSVEEMKAELEQEDEKEKEALEVAANTIQQRDERVKQRNRIYARRSRIRKKLTRAERDGMCRAIWNDYIELRAVLVTKLGEEECVKMGLYPLEHDILEVAAQYTHTLTQDIPTEDAEIRKAEERYGIRKRPKN